MNVTANKKLFSTSKTSFQSNNSSFQVQKTWVPTRSWSIPETIHQQSQQQISRTKEILNLLGPRKFYDNILTKLQKDVKNIKGGNLRYFSKNWYKYTKDKYILDIVTNGFKLDLKQLPTQNSRSTYPLLNKEN